MEEIKFNLKELLKFACSMEEIGIKFYNDLAENVQSNQKDVFKTLASEERGHAKLFEKWFNAAGANFDDSYLFDSEANFYFNGIVKSVNFEEIKKADTFKDAIDIALKIEQNSIDFYEKIAEYASEDIIDVLKKITVEEYEHKRILRSLLND